MKIRPFVALLILAACPLAAETFPGLRAVLTEAEWQRAGLDRLSPDQIGVVDAALIRHLAQRSSPPDTASAQAEGGGAPKTGWLQRFGLPTFDEDWRSVPPLRAKVIAWEAANRFRLDNGQVWEGFDPIRLELVGRQIEIQARRNNQFALIVEGHNTTVRVFRLR